MTLPPCVRPLAAIAAAILLACGAAADDPADEARIERLIQQLGAASYATRQQATRALIKCGEPAVPALDAAARSSEPEVRQRARTILARIGLSWRPELKQLLPPGATRVDWAVALGLVWLKLHQSADGLWRATRLGDLCGPVRCEGRALMDWVDTGVSGLALLAFLGAGHTQRVGPFADTLRRGARALIRLQKPDGLIGPSRGHYMYNHAIGSLALIELYRTTRDAAYREHSERAVRWLVRARNPGLGWRYRPRGGDNDISVTSWATYACKAASVAGLEVDGLRDALRGARQLASRVTNDTYGLSGYTRPPPRGWQGPTSSRFQAPAIGVDTSGTHAANHSPTAMATTIRALCGVAPDAPAQRRARAFLGSQLPVWDSGGGGKLSKLDYYYWYQGALATSGLGGDSWSVWSKALERTLIPNQAHRGHHQGSWEPTAAWCFAGGRIYSTAINLLSLEVVQRDQRARPPKGGGTDRK